MQRLGEAGLGGEATALGLHPVAQFAEDGYGLGLANGQPLLGLVARDPALDVVKEADAAQCLFGDGRARALVLLIELAARMRPAGGVDDAR